MSRIPDFSTVDLVAGAAAVPLTGEPWLTPEGIAVKPL
jgi:methylmalonyl-CoA mutase